MRTGLDKAPKTWNIGIIGTGRLGSALAEALHGAGYELTALASSSDSGAGSGARSLASSMSGTRALTADELVGACELVFLTVPDGVIASVCAGLPWRPDQAAVHASGALGLDALSAAAAAGALVGCLHPLQSFPGGAGGGARFSGVVCGVEAPGPLGDVLEAICADLGAGSVRLEGVDRARYHAAAVFTSNYVVALHALAERAWASAGLPAERARAALAPLTLGAADNIARLPLARALTGPVARGDAATVGDHLRALASQPELSELYGSLARALLELDLPLDDPARLALEAVLGKALD